GRAVVQIQRLWLAMLADRPREDPQHVYLALRMQRDQREHATTEVVEHAVDSQRLFPLSADHLGPVADVGVPQLPGIGSFPATPVLAGCLVILAEPLEPMLAVQSSQRVDADFASGKAALALERPHDERGRHRRVFAPDLQEQGPGHVVEDTRYARIAPLLWAQRLHATGPQPIQPALE